MMPTPPAIPVNPEKLIDVDITDVTESVNELSLVESTGNNIPPGMVSDAVMGAAEAYESAVIFSHSPGGLWLANLTTTIQQMTANIAILRQRSDELPVLLANNRAGNTGPLYNPTLVVNGFGPPLAPPNPQTRDELSHFSGPQCAASAANLGLPAMPNHIPLLQRRQQIAIRLGVTI